MQFRKILAAMIVFSFLSTLGLSLVAQAAPPTNSVVVQGKTGSVTLSLSNLTAMPVAQGISSYQNRLGNWKAIGTYAGVNISYLVGQVGGMVPGDTVTIYASDGYNKTYSYNNVYDAWSNKSIQGPMILAYSFNGTVVPTWPGGLMVAFLPPDHAYSNVDCNATTTLDVKTSSAGSLWVGSVDKIVVNSAPWTVTLTRGTSTMTYGGQQIENMTSVTARGGYIKSTGALVGPDNYTGLNLSYLLQSIGGISPTDGITVTARDSYQMTFTYNLMMGNATVWTVLAYRMNGVMMSMTDIPRIVFIGPTAPMTDGHLWARMVSSIVAVPAITEYNLTLVGAYTMSVDRQYLEAGISCHRTNYTVGTKTYTGIPLWMLCGFVEDTHSLGNGTPMVFRNDLNYTVTVFASDNYNKTLSFKTVARNNTIIIANAVNGTLLTGMDPPLQLVSGLPKSYSIKGVDKIVLNWNVSMDLSVNKSTVKPGEPVTITATISDKTPISGENVSFYVNGVKLGEALTDSSGNATTQYTPGANGNYTIQAKFVFGTIENVKSTTVTAATPAKSGGGGIDLGIVAIVIVIVVVIIALLAFAFLRKR